MMASELLLGALLACQHSTFVKVAAKRRVAAKVVAIDGALAFADGAIHHADVNFELETDEGDESIATLLRLTDRSCTVSRALNVPVEATWKNAKRL